MRGKHTVMLRPAVYAACREAVDSAFELFPLRLAGKKILIKPNVLRRAAPEEAVTTHPAVVRAVIERVLESKPGALWVGDNPGVAGYGNNEDCFRASGLKEAAGEHYVNISDRSAVVPFAPAAEGNIQVSSAVLEADVVISVPKFKTHGLTLLSGAIKNSYGILPGALKGRLHQRAGNPGAFQRMILDVFKLRVPDLFIMDAILGMQGNGPTSKDLRHIGVIMASDNAVAMDAVMARMAGLDPRALPVLVLAAEQGLGSFEKDDIHIDGEFKLLHDFRLPLMPESGYAAPGLGHFIDRSLAVGPMVNSELCIACGECVEICPGKALAVEGELPQVDLGKCIRCYCCQELCPQNAIQLKTDV
ncbi:MAG: DUF362 domain-containing protein [Desulfovibrionaceae bacterium]|nr:DUF362 domain-containing protein [Desulfovibrionaceae bacterium]